MVAGDEHKRQQKGSLFMTLTLIVAGPAMPAVPRFPRICHQRKDISHTCWEGDPTSYAWLFQSIRFHRRLSQSWAEEEQTGKMMPAPPVLLPPPRWLWLSGSLHDPLPLPGSQDASCSRDLVSFLSKMELGSGNLSLSDPNLMVPLFFFVVNWSALPVVS